MMLMDMTTLYCSVSRQLLPIFNSNGLSLRVIIPPTSGFHYSIVSSFVTFGNQILC